VEDSEAPLGFTVQVGGICQLLVHPEGEFPLGKVVLHLNLQLSGRQDRRGDGGGWESADARGGLPNGFRGYFSNLDTLRGAFAGGLISGKSIIAGAGSV